MQYRIVFAALVASSLAQSNTDSSTYNSDAAIYSCDRLPCASSASNGLCKSSSGLGLVANAVRLPRADTNLSLTLVDGPPLGILQQPPLPYEFATRALYVGASADTDLRAQPPACALLMQYDSATFPYFTNNAPANRNSTTCPTGFAYTNDISHMVATIQGFKYSSNNNSTSLSRCEALAAYVEQDINSNITFGAYYGSLISVSGGAIAGSDVVQDQRQTLYNSDAGSSNCQPSLPQDNQLYNVTAATEILRKYPQSQNSTYGGRTGYSPVVSVVYNSESDRSPDVSVYCLHLWSTNGTALPYSSLTADTSKGAMTFGRASAGVVAAALITAVWSALI